MYSIYLSHIVLKIACDVQNNLKQICYELEKHETKLLDTLSNFYSMSLHHMFVLDKNIKILSSINRIDY